MIRHATAFKSFVLLGWAALFSAAAAADPLTSVASFPSAPNDGTTPWTETVQLNQFDPTLGALSGVAFTFTALVETEIIVTHNESGARAVLAGATLQYALPSRNVTQTIEIPVAIPGCTALATCQFMSGVLAKSETLEVSLLESEFAPYVGTGTFGVTVSASGISALPDPQERIVPLQTLDKMTNRATGSVRVTYVPEPGSLALLAVACIALGVFQRRSTQIQVGASRASGPAKRPIA